VGVVIILKIKCLFFLVSTDVLNTIPNLVDFGKQEMVSNHHECGNPSLNQKHLFGLKNL